MIKNNACALDIKKVIDKATFYRFYKKVGNLYVIYNMVPIVIIKNNHADFSKTSINIS